MMTRDDLLTDPQGQISARTLNSVISSVGNLSIWRVQVTSVPQEMR